ncbi:hypothetical protein [Helicobacter typhlonius]|uniref:hypothetical protein n=1 Tax=Helicobacter typhlonius TaxID=76936 RepID=UPI002FE3A88E
MDIKGILEQCGIYTRIVPCELEVAFSKLDESNKMACDREFVALSQYRYGSIMQWLNKNKSKNRTQDTDEVLLELLVELYQKVENIEQMLRNKTTQYLPLDFGGVADFVGHSVLCMPQDVFEEGAEYYMRIFLPVFPQRYIGIFGSAIHNRIIKFERMHYNDTGDFDNFVAQMERLSILNAKKIYTTEE